MICPNCGSDELVSSEDIDVGDDGYLIIVTEYYCLDCSFEHFYNRLYINKDGLPVESDLLYENLII